VSHRRTLATAIHGLRSLDAGLGPIPHPLRILPALGQQRRLRDTGNPEPSNDVLAAAIQAPLREQGG
jgi:hypothetical protein